MLITIAQFGQIRVFFEFIMPPFVDSMHFGAHAMPETDDVRIGTSDVHKLRIVMSLPCTVQEDSYFRPIAYVVPYVAERQIKAMACNSTPKYSPAVSKVINLLTRKRRVTHRKRSKPHTKSHRRATLPTYNKSRCKGGHRC